MLIPLRTKNPPESLPIATCALIAINVAVFSATSDALTAKPDILAKYGDAFSNHSP